MNARMTIADDELINPTGLEIRADGDIYISNKGFFAGVGEVLGLSLEKDTTEGYAPLRDLVKPHTTTIAAKGDRVDASYSVVPNSTADRLQIALTSGWDCTG